jgi:hypothetical protein
MKVNLFLAGFAKSGSSYIYSLLSNQARVSGGLEKEPAFFCFANKKSIDWYHDFYGRNRYLIDGTVEYSMGTGVCDRVFNYNPEAKIIFVIREPLSRAWSHYCHRLKMGEELRTLKEIHHSDLEQDYLVDYSRFKHRIEAWSLIFGPDRVIVFTLDQIENDQKTLCKRLEKFLQIEVDYDVTGIDRNFSRVPRLIWFARFGAVVRRMRVIDWPMPSFLKILLRKMNRRLQSLNLMEADNPEPPFWWREKLTPYLESDISYYNEMVESGK